MKLHQKQEVLLLCIFFNSFFIQIQTATLIGGYVDNKNGTLQNKTNTNYSSEFQNNSHITGESSSEKYEDYEYEDDVEDEKEKIPKPSALVLPGYNLPDQLFNKGKPFYAEKDPLTGKIDFASKISSGKVYEDEYEYVDEQPNDHIYDKANIDRKDGGYGSHRPNSVNQLSPNFHDYLNLPTKYNQEKYVYPLISSSYANTKVQGNVNSFNDYKYKVTTYKPTVSPSYYTTKIGPNPSTQFHTIRTTQYSSPATKATDSVYITSTLKPQSYTTPNLLNSPMNHQSWTAENSDDYYYYDTTEKKQNVYITSEAPEKDIYITTKKHTYQSSPPSTRNQYTSKFPHREEYKTTTTERPLSIFAQLLSGFDYMTDEEEVSQPNVSAHDMWSAGNHSNAVHTTQRTSSTTDFNNIHIKLPVNQSLHNANSNSPSPPPQSQEEDEYIYYYDDKIPTSSPEEYKTQQQTSESISFNEIGSIFTQKPDFVNSHIRNVSSALENNILYKNDIQSNKTNLGNDDDNFNKGSSNIELNIKHSTESSVIYGQTYNPTPSAATPATNRITSLPLGTTHLPKSRYPAIITLTQDIKEKLNNEKVGIVKHPEETHLTSHSSYSNKNSHTVLQQPVIHQLPKNTNNIHIPHDQDTVSFVLGQHQNVVQYTDDIHINQQSTTSAPELITYAQQIHNPSYQEPNAASAINLQPIRGSEMSLSIGLPADRVVPGQVMDEKLEINDDIEYPKTPEMKIVFPKDDEENSTPNLIHSGTTQLQADVLPLNSKPVYHQLPSDLTPPSEQDLRPPHRVSNLHPPWDPRPGHFFQGRPEYTRPPRPQVPVENYVIETLPNILPRFRPNAKLSVGHHGDTVGTLNAGYNHRQPLLDRPSNRPIGFFEKLQPPPPPPPQRILNLRKDDLHIRPPEIYPHDKTGPELNKALPDYLDIYKAPPRVLVANRRNEKDEVATLQMLKAKNSEKLETIKPNSLPPHDGKYSKTDKPIYVVYPVNSAPLKLDVLDNNKKESVVIGTRNEQPLPPSEIKKDDLNEQKPLLGPKDRNDAPILKPHPRPTNFPIKSDFPYPLERPDPSILSTELPISSTDFHISSTVKPPATENTDTHGSNWELDNSESRIVNGGKINIPPNQISVTLKTYPEKPIAIAYTPTESYNSGYNSPTSKYSMSNFAQHALSEIHPGVVDDAVFGGPQTNKEKKSEFTVSAVMHTQSNQDNNVHGGIQKVEYLQKLEHHKLSDAEKEINSYTPDKLDFQAPFQASVNIGSNQQGWSVIRNKSKFEIDRSDTDVLPVHSTETTSEFDIENFTPQLYGGFKPILTYPKENEKESVSTSERQE